MYIQICVHKSVYTNCFGLLDLIGTAQRTIAHTSALKHVTMRQSIVYSVYQGQARVLKQSESSEQCTRQQLGTHYGKSAQLISHCCNFRSIILKSVDSNCFGLLELIIYIYTWCVFIKPGYNLK